MSDPKNLTTKEVATLLNCSESLVRRSDMKKKLCAFYIGKKALRYPKEAVDSYINDQMKLSSAHHSEDKIKVQNTHRRKKLHSKFDLF
ncbi:helix-turn-helix domain-containing protein [Halodesulfovibrio spirochaetisodalis]|uniref:Helix-turn-helix domain-containing protein n=1 Tax=Halodesulfovibrio spirochaetisodalis TaxID=1560234 RepID=A0A1B7XI48_9BACT|nr:helix-turn-helix domain-containing protein [Halodesulfovibrio spirochaetisodalis]OBQ55197.1 hypothetical protein SP90_04310 [Halodesulfovibrio spirochaetisodalis]